MRGGLKRNRYHHGDLRPALLDITVELIAEHGVDNFSLAEASRRLGVASSAPYRHFTDREELLTAVAVRAAEVLVTVIEAEASEATAPAERLAALARGYVRFAAQQPALFAALTRSIGHRAPERAAAPVKRLMADAATALSDGDLAAAEDLAYAIGSTAHGYAEMFRLALLGETPQDVDVAARRAAAAVRALIAGRNELVH